MPEPKPEPRVKPPARARKARPKAASGPAQGPIGNTTGVFIPVVKPNLGGGATKIPIVPQTQEEQGFLERKQAQLQDKIDDWVAAQRDSRVAMAGGALATALNQVLFPTSGFELVPAGKVFKMVKKGKGAIEAAREARKTAQARKAGKVEKEATEAKKASENSGGRVDPKKQKPHKHCGKVSTYSKAPKKLGELNADHVPSGAALKKAAEDKLESLGVLRRLSVEQKQSVLNRVYNHAKTITVPEDVHKEGRTWGSKNKPHIDGDSKNLSEAFRKDTEAIQQAMDTKDHGCSDEYRRAVEELRNFDFDAYVEDAVKSHKSVARLLKK